MRVTSKKLAWIFGLILSSLVIVSAFHSEKLMAVAKERYQDLQLFAKVLNLVQQYYVEEVDTKKLIYGGIKGMLRELDPHTNFLPPDIFAEFESETSGEFGGLGVEITVQDGVLTVISPIEDTPAWKAGIKAGDKIVEVNGESTKGLSLAEAALKMKGKLGSKVRLGIYREGFDKPKEFAIERGTVKIRSVKYTDMEDGYAYVRLTSFIENSFTDFDKALKMHEKKNPTKGLILDLRRNPGGLLEQAVQISDMFLESGVIVSTIGRNKKEKEVVYAKRPGTRPLFPIVALVDEYSASASEILAGALQDNRRALIMGQRTFGKGSVQSVVKLGDGSGLKLTVARYYTPKGRSIQAEGIVPDVVIDDMAIEDLQKTLNKKNVRREKDIEGHLLSEEEVREGKGKKDASSNANFWWVGDKGKDDKLSPRDKLLKDDFQIMQAYNYLKAWKVMREFDKPQAAATPEGAITNPPAVDTKAPPEAVDEPKDSEDQRPQESNEPASGTSTPTPAVKSSAPAAKSAPTQKAAPKAVAKPAPKSAVTTKKPVPATAKPLPAAPAAKPKEVPAE